MDLDLLDESIPICKLIWYPILARILKVTYKGKVLSLKKGNDKVADCAFKQPWT